MSTVGQPTPEPLPSQLMAWRELAKLAAHRDYPELAELLEDSRRGASLRHQVDGVLFDFSRQRVTGASLNALLDLAEERKWTRQVQALFDGERVNNTEDRPALHTALRTPAEFQPAGAGGDLIPTRRRLLGLAESIGQGRRTGYTGKAFDRVVHIGIGGSHLGPALVTDALGGADGPLKIAYVANIDGQAITDALAGADAATTLFILVSKSFATLETQVNATTARNWFLERTGRLDALAEHFIAVTANAEGAASFGLPKENLFPLWEWVSGRFSLWSNVGLTIALCLGTKGFKALLAGAHAMDRHFQQAPAAANAPLLAALIDIWNYNFLGATSQVILPYDQRLRLLPAYLQQLATESNGKRASRGGADVGVPTMPPVWGGEGTASQHSFHQMLHQGTGAFTADFILTGQPNHKLDEHHRWLLANGLAQGQAMALGWRSDDPHQRAPGNHGVSTLVLDRLNARNLGLLLAFYEHRVFCQGLIWNLNSFDQWGVRFGKHLANSVFEQLGGTAPSQHDSTRSLIKHLRALKRTTDDDAISSQ